MTGKGILALLLVAAAVGIVSLWQPWAGAPERRDAPDGAGIGSDGGARRPTRGVTARGRRAAPARSQHGRIRGLVRRRGDGKGIGGATLAWLDVARTPPEERARRQTGSTGHFALDLAAGRYQLKLSAAGHRLPAAAPPLWVMDDARADEWVIDVERDSVLHGELVDAGGRPLANALVGVAGVWRASGWSRRRPEREAVTTAADGAFSLPVPAGVIRLALRADERWVAAPTLVAPTGKALFGLRLVARRDATIEGQVLGPGAVRVGGATVILDDLVERREVRCEADGRFVVRGLSVGEVFLAARATGLATAAIARLKLRAGAEQRVVLQLQRVVSQPGRVVGTDGRGVGGARVQLDELATARGASPLPVTTPSVRSRPDGRFSIELDGRPRTVFAAAPGPLRGALKGVTSQSEAVVLRVSAPGEIVGRITSSGGKPLGVLQLTVDDGGRRRRLWVVTGKGGHFRLDGLTAGSVSIDVEVPRYASKHVELSLRAGYATPIELRLPAGGRVRGQVLTAGSGAPVTGALVRVEGHPAWAVTDFEGRFVLRGLEEGRHAAWIRHPDYRAARVADVRVSAGLTTELPPVGVAAVSSSDLRPWRPERVLPLPEKGD